MNRGANGGESASKQQLLLGICQDRKRKQYSAGRNKAACHVEKFARLGGRVSYGKTKSVSSVGDDLAKLRFLFENLPAQLIKGLLQEGQ